jgi:hypothetical protein
MHRQFSLVAGTAVLALLCTNGPAGADLFIFKDGFVIDGAKVKQAITFEVDAPTGQSVPIPLGTGARRIYFLAGIGATGWNGLGYGLFGSVVVGISGLMLGGVENQGQ